MNEQFIEEMADLVGAEPDFRAEVPVGTEIGRQSAQPGHETVWRKTGSKVRIGDRELPERVALFDLQRGDRSMVPPTIAQKRMMDYPRRFTLRPPADWKEPEPIADTCEICLMNRRKEGIDTPKKFYNRYDLINHMRYLHTNEWDAIEQNRRDEERREDTGRMEKLIASIAGMFAAGANLPPEVKAQIAGLQADEATAKKGKGQ